MYLRRNENESSEQLVNLLTKFERINLTLQFKLYEKCDQFIKMGYQMDKFYETIFTSQTWF